MSTFLNVCVAALLLIAAVGVYAVLMMLYDKICAYIRSREDETDHQDSYW